MKHLKIRQNQQFLLTYSKEKKESNTVEVRLKKAGTIYLVCTGASRDV